MTNDAPHSAPTPLSRFLGGWMRHPSPQEPDQPADAATDESADATTEAPEVAKRADAPQPAVSSDATESPTEPATSAGLVDDADSAAGPRGFGESEPLGHDSPATAGVEDSQDAESAESAESSESTEDAEDLDAEEEHIIEVADPRDFADDSGPQYEDEDFDDIVDGGTAPAPGPIGTATPAIAPSSITSASSQSDASVALQFAAASLIAHM